MSVSHSIINTTEKRRLMLNGHLESMKDITWPRKIWKWAQREDAEQGNLEEHGVKGFKKQ